MCHGRTSRRDSIIGSRGAAGFRSGGKLGERRVNNEFDYG
ncbi:hypothetical protein BIFBIF_00701 [Bifidobacterium bifidum ATCC 29521 = JCM 1255 = DSM 20456]|nr:hypothetical protein BIFBIF_00701 [Bifidobacterium bifidum ATCC 29521 = JCM 1255 = DSM 20456]